MTLRHGSADRRLAPATALALFVLGPALAVGLAGDDARSMEKVAAAWRAEAGHQFRRAHEQFQRAGESREARFGRAVTLLNVQPKTRDNIEAAAEAFRALHAQTPDDEVGVAARYFLARVEQMHRYQPKPDRAMAHFAALFAEHPNHFYGQLALVKWGMLRLYDPANTEADRADLLDELEAKGRRLNHEDARRSFHMMMADAICRFERSDERAMEHLLVVDELGVMTRTAEADLYVRIGELARLAGRLDLARRYYRRMLERFPRDTRGYMVRERLEQMGGGNAAATGGQP